MRESYNNIYILDQSSSVNQQFIYIVRKHIFICGIFTKDSNACDIFDSLSIPENIF